MKTSVVVSMYNSKKETIDLVDKLFFPSLMNQGSKQTELIIIDDDSPLERETREMVDNHLKDLQYGSVRFIKNRKNLGFGASYNKGITLARGEYVFVVTDDVYLPPGSVNNLVKTLENPDYGIAGPITNDPMTATYQYCRQSPRISDYSEEQFNNIDEFAEKIREKFKGKIFRMNMLAGFCFAVPSSVIDEVGSFDESFGYALFEDFDLVRRIGQKYQIILDPSVYVHHGGISGASRTLIQTPVKSIYFGFRNLLHYAIKWKDPVGAADLVLRGVYRALTGKQTISEKFDKT